MKHLSKQYQIGVDKTYKTLSESLTTGLRHPVRSLQNIGAMGAKDSFWAIKDVNFEVERGEVRGIIGRNGAGKSTLLKVLSRITYPTEGEVIMRGRVGSLLEVGTGFHPELTGRENIYFNGAILGMKKREIDDKFDEIVKFSGVEKFLDTPVKRYSSGMQVRLAFSVAAHLEPEILLVDEVLAVGDAEFQKKCLGKMGEVASEGRTVLFVSHNMGAISDLCDRCLLVENGNIVSDSTTRDVIDQYLSPNLLSNGYVQFDHGRECPTDGKYVRIISITLLNSSKSMSSQVFAEDICFISINYEIIEPIRNCWLGFSIHTSNNEIIFYTGDYNRSNANMDSRQPGIYMSQCEIPGYLLNGGTYSVSLLCQIPGDKILVYLPNILFFEVLTQKSLIGSGTQPGFIRPLLKWNTCKCENGG